MKYQSNRTPYGALNGSISHIPLGKKIFPEGPHSHNERAVMLYVLNHITQKYDLPPDWILEENLPLENKKGKVAYQLIYLSSGLQIVQDILRRDSQVRLRDMIDYSWRTWSVLISYTSNMKDREIFKAIYSDIIVSLIDTLSDKKTQMQNLDQSDIAQFLRILHQVYFPEKYPSTLPEPPPVITVGNYKKYMANPNSC